MRFVLWGLLFLVTAPAFAAKITCRGLMRQYYQGQFEELVVAYDAFVATLRRRDPVSIALGIMRNPVAPSDLESGLLDDSSLLRFALARSIETGKKVVPWRDFDVVGFNKQGKNSLADVGEVIEDTIKKAMKRSPGEPVVYFNLDRFDTKLAFGDGIPPKIKKATVIEAHVILSNPQYLGVTRWYQNGRELSTAQVKKFFRPYYQESFDKL